MESQNRDLQTALQILTKLDLASSHHLASCANRRVAVLSTFDAPWYARAYRWIAAKFRGKIELFWFLRREVTKLREDNARLRARLERELQKAIRR